MTQQIDRPFYWPFVSVAYRPLFVRLLLWRQDPGQGGYLYYDRDEAPAKRTSPKRPLRRKLISLLVIILKPVGFLIGLFVLWLVASIAGLGLAKLLQPIPRPFDFFIIFGPLGAIALYGVWRRNWKFYFPAIGLIVVAVLSATGR